MKTLYIVRHAKANFGDPNYEDHENPLNEKGLKDAPEVGKKLAAEGVKVDAVLSSTAKRAITTAELIAGELGYDGVRTIESLFNAPADVIMEVLQEEGTGASLMLVAHNPGISEFANRLLGETGISMGAGDVVVAQLDIDSWEDCVWGVGKLLKYVEKR